MRQTRPDLSLIHILSEPTHLEGCMLLLSGMEMDFTLPGEVLHLIGVGMDERCLLYTSRCV